MSDGGVLELTTDPTVYSPYLLAFLSGNFRISFEREGFPGIRSYNVQQKPPPKVVSEFQACVASMKQ